MIRYDNCDTHWDTRFPLQKTNPASPFLLFRTFLSFVYSCKKYTSPQSGKIISRLFSQRLYNTQNQRNKKNQFSTYENRAPPFSDVRLFRTISSHPWMSWMVTVRICSLAYSVMWLSAWFGNMATFATFSTQSWPEKSWPLTQQLYVQMHVKKHRKKWLDNISSSPIFFRINLLSDLLTDWFPCLHKDLRDNTGKLTPRTQVPYPTKPATPPIGKKASIDQQ